jgi:hypothetical protein
LDCCYWLDSVCPANRVYACLRKAEVLDLACLNQFPHSSGDILDWDVRIDTMLVVKIDCIDPKPLERALSGLFDVFGPAIQTCRSRAMIAATQIETELGGDHYFAMEGSEGFADKLFVRERAVNFGGIEECDAEFHGGTQK